MMISKLSLNIKVSIGGENEKIIVLASKEAENGKKRLR
jgi:hypothetical protein